MLSFQALALDHYYDLTLEYNQTSKLFTLESLELKPLLKDLSEQYGSHKAKLVSFNNEILNETYFDTDYYIIVEGIDPDTGFFMGEKKDFNKSEITIQLPYYENAKKIVVSDGLDRDLFSVDVSKYSKEKESTEETPQKKDISGEIKPKTGEKSAEEISGNKTNKNLLIPLLIVFAVLLIMLVSIFLIRRKQPA